MIVGTAGHIDHGKTSLVRRLTGVDTDRLKEEKARGISIDLGFAYWTRPGGEIIGFVDVPGHEGLVHNMLAGATGIDFVILVIAADDGVMPQTREHLAIMNLLGLKRGLVALNKCDLVTADRIDAVKSEIASVLAGTGLEGAEILPVSAVTGEGLDALTHRLDAAITTATARPKEGLFRLAVDRSFTLTGLGTAVTGTVISGTVRVDDHVLISPSGIEARVRSINAPCPSSRKRSNSSWQYERWLTSSSATIASPRLSSGSSRKQSSICATCSAARCSVTRLWARYRMISSVDKGRSSRRRAWDSPMPRRSSSMQ